MSEGTGGGVAKILEQLAEGLPGFAVASVMLGIALPLLFPEVSTTAATHVAKPKIREFIPVIAVILAFAGNQVGHYLDDWLFDPIWGVNGLISGRKEWLTRKFGEQRATKTNDPRTAKPSLKSWALQLILALDTARTSLATEWKVPLIGIFAKADQLATKTDVGRKR